jgi:eukaryotic-like serine/threonine-protein kinase
MKDLVFFLKSKTFYKHFSIGLLVLFCLLYLLYKLLAVYTEHDKTIPVPDFNGVMVNNLNSFIQDKGIKYLIIDSTYIPGSKAGIVINQDPPPNTRVKPKRIVYLYTTTRNPPLIEMPQLAERSLKHALNLISSYGLKKGKIKYEPGYENLVLRQIIEGKSYTAEEIKKAKELSLGDKKYSPLMTKKGVVVDLIVGSGQPETADTIPEK